MGRVFWWMRGRRRCAFRGIVVVSMLGTVNWELLKRGAGYVITILYEVSTTIIGSISLLDIMHTIYVFPAHL
jgi:hypothetical protein